MFGRTSEDRKERRGGGGIRLPLAFVFVLAVLLPCVALSLLALRAANREALYVERRLENTLLAEVNHAAGQIADLLRRIGRELADDAPLEGSVEAALESWRRRNALVAVPFALEAGRLSTPDPAGADDRAFRSAFGAFLEGRTELPVYDDIANVYRRRMTADADDGREWTPFASLRSKTEAPGATERNEEHPSGGRAPEAEPENHIAAPVAEEAPSAPKALSALPKGTPAVPERAWDGVERQKAAGRIATDSTLREETFRKAEKEGFRLLQRNVMPQAQVQMTPPGGAKEERSKTVSRGRSFRDLSLEGEWGLLPRLSETGLDLLFWMRRPGGAVGCTVSMGELRNRLADVVPETRSEVRILTVLDESGKPVFIPENAPRPDWRRPFVAREISPLLPRWEAGAWLSDPSLVESQAHFVSIVATLLVATLFVVIAAGGAVVIRTLSSETRLARQKTTFVANVSHELKTPLTSIRLFAEMLLQRRQPDERKRDEYLRTMLSEAERLSRLVDNVLAFSRKGTAKADYAMEDLDLSRLAGETVAQLEPNLTRNGFSLSTDLEESVTVRGNPEALRQVLMNLFSNAEKYSGETKEISVSTCTDDDEAVVRVMDRGIGVDPGKATRIFEEFYRCDDSLSSSRSGTGLGLSIARDIARRHGGDVTYAPREGGGSVFSLRLPGLPRENDRRRTPS
jgi:signal transduction histidine kinase